MKEIRSLLLSTFLVFFTLFFFIGCENKKEESPFTVIENTTTVFTPKDKKQQQENINRNSENEETPAVQISTDTFTLSDLKQNQQTLTLKNEKIIFHNIDQSIVVLNFFATWCSPCRAEIPYLSDLQKKYKKKVFIAGILVNDEQSDDTLKQFISKYYAKYFISNSKQNDTFAAKLVKKLHLAENFPIPLTVIYKNGNYYTHYEGAVPVEMIDHDLQEAIKK